MSFDLMVFDPKLAPRLRPDFLDWFRAGTQLEAGHDYNSPEQLTAPLQSFYHRFQPLFPPRNGPEAAPALDTVPRSFWQRLAGAPRFPSAPAPNRRLTDYLFGAGFIYLGFARPLAGEAYRAVLRTAHDTGTGFFNAASDWGEILHDADQFLPFLGDGETGG